MSRWRANPCWARLQRVEGVAGGQVCLKGTGVCAEFVVSRFAAGESIGALALDYRVEPDTISAAIQAVLILRSSGGFWSSGGLKRLDTYLPMQQPKRRKSHDV